MFKRKKDKYMLCCPVHGVITSVIDVYDIKPCRLNHSRSGCPEHVDILKFMKKDYYETKNLGSPMRDVYSVPWDGLPDGTATANFIYEKQLDKIQSLLQGTICRRGYRWECAYSGLIIDGYKIPDNVEIFLRGDGEVDWTPRYLPREKHKIKNWPLM